MNAAEDRERDYAGERKHTLPHEVPQLLDLIGHHSWLLSRRALPFHCHFAGV